MATWLASCASTSKRSSVWETCISTLQYIHTHRILSASGDHFVVSDASVILNTHHAALTNPEISHISHYLCPFYKPTAFKSYHHANHIRTALKVKEASVRSPFFIKGIKDGAALTPVLKKATVTLSSFTSALVSWFRPLFKFPLAAENVFPGDPQDFDQLHSMDMPVHLPTHR